MSDPAEALIHIFLFGPPRVTVAGQPVTINRRKALALLAYLALAEKPVGRAVLAVLLSPELSSERSNADLRRALVVLRQAGLGPYLAADRETIELKTDAGMWVDVRVFNQLLRPPPDPDALQRAVDLYRDDLMAGFSLRDSETFEDWHLAQRQRYQQRFTGAIETLIQLYTQRQDDRPAIALMERWLAQDGLDDHANRQAMQLYALSGQPLAAQRVYEHYRQRLLTEMGVEPEHETAQLYEAIKSGATVRETHLPLIGRLPQRPALALGREEPMRVLKTMLCQANIGPVVIQGWPGIGKTTVGALLAHDPEIAQAFPDGVLWVSLGQYPNLLTELNAWAEAAGLPAGDESDSLEQISARLAARLRDRRLLLIIDDVWNASDFKPFLVGGPESAVLASTRANDVAREVAATPERIYKLPILDEARSFELLRRLAGAAVEQNETAVRDLIRDLEGLPLALQVAGRLLWAEHAMGWGVEDLLAELREGSRLLQAQSPADRAEAMHDAPPTVAVLLQRSTDRLDVETRQYFALLGVFAPKPATFDLPALEAVWDVQDARPIVRVLVNRGLMEPANGEFQIHALLVAHARTLFEHKDG